MPSNTRPHNFRTSIPRNILLSRSVTDETEVINYQQVGREVFSDAR
jgi:hypothetical protein